MEEFFRLLWLALNWRVLLIGSISVYAAVYSAQTFSWFSGPQGIALAMIGIFAGMLWNEAAWEPSGPPATPDTPEHTSITVATLSSAFGGFAWGSLSTHSLGSIIFGLMLLIAIAAVLFRWRSSVHERRVPTIYLTFCLGSALAGFAAPVIQSSLQS